MNKNNLKKLRENTYFDGNKIKKQTEVVNDLNLNYSAYNDWERNKNNISIEQADMFALYYNVSLSTVLGFDNNIDKHVDLKPLNYDKLLSNLKELKNNCGRTYEYIGKKIYSTTQHTQKYFNGKRKITPDTLYMLSEFFEVDIDTLCGKTDDL